MTDPGLCLVLVALEGPDPYARAGGLGVRVTGLAHALAAAGIETHLIFFGDPSAPPREVLAGGRLVLHRWAQWLCARHPRGVYDGEHAKRDELARALPSFLLREIVGPALEAGRLPVVLCEEWQTAAFACELSDHLHAHGCRPRVLQFWNANNPYGFDRVDWARLAYTNRLLAVSRWMRAILRGWGVDAAVVPNGIPDRLVGGTPSTDGVRLRRVLAGRATFFKMARWEHEKGWLPTLAALRQLRREGAAATLIARSGGTDGATGGLVATALAQGLRARAVTDAEQLECELAAGAHADTDVLSLHFPVHEPLARALYAASDGVLANSLYEPFGLVGLEAMAAGGLVYTGGTGEDYAVHGRNAVVLRTLDPGELARYAARLAREPRRAVRLRQQAQRTARRFAWSRVIGLLLREVREAARRQGVPLP